MVLIALAAAASPVVAWASAAMPSFFHSKEIRSNNMKPFTKWNSALSKYARETAMARKGSCNAHEMNVCHYQEWTKFLLSIVKKPKMEQLRAVNDYMNRAKYITDPVNWGVKDYWESPGEFMAKFGDCEDYAIAKYMSLERLGWKEGTMRVVAVRDLNLKVGHAVLVVFLNGKSWLLDNQIKQVVETSVVHHYQPVFSLTEHFWWLHRIIS